MTVRHLVGGDNVTPQGTVRDPRRVRHGALRAGRVCALAGEVDPDTHLNLDFPDHRLDVCVVVERLVVGAPALSGGDGFRVAGVGSEAFAPRGPVDVGARRAAWLDAYHARQAGAGAPAP